MVNVFEQQKIFMEASDQSTGIYNENQYDLYCELIKEEYDDEFLTALYEGDKVGQLDALLDMLVVTIGALHSLGVDVEGSWNEVIQSNLSKIDAKTGKVLKREDGKVLKPEGWKPPELEKYFIWGDN